MEPRPEWTAIEPSLADRCLALSDDELAPLESSPEALYDWLQTDIPQLHRLRELIALPFSSSREFNLGKHWAAGIPGRKAEQIKAFAQAVSPQGVPYVDWCSGKAHLGRTLSRLHRTPCLALEFNSELCMQGAQLAAKQKIDTKFIVNNVLNSAVRLPRESHVVALHACGDLHRSLVAQVSESPVGALNLAPCCYSLWVEDVYVPRSKTAKKYNLKLNRNDLNLAVQETVTSSVKERENSQKQAEWRLGFDSLQREIRHENTYLNTPSLPLSSLKGGFASYCLRLAELKLLSIPEGIDWPYFQRLGEQRFQAQRRLQLVRHAFRRAIELWLVLDLKSCLEDSGYLVTLSEFCARELTPRNIMLHAKRP